MSDKFPDIIRLNEVNRVLREKLEAKEREYEHDTNSLMQDRKELYNENKRLREENKRLSEFERFYDATQTILNDDQIMAVIDHWKGGDSDE